MYRIKALKQYIEEKLRELGLTNKVLVLEGPVEPLGRGSQLCNDIIPCNRCTLLSPCDDIGSVLTILPTGHIMACCGHVISLPEGLKMFCLGRLPYDNLIHAIKRVSRNLFYIALRILGPVKLLEELSLRCKISYTSIYGRCYACYIIAKHYDSIVSRITKNDLVQILVESLSKNLPSK